MNKTRKLDNLIKLRKDKGLTQIQMAKELNVAQNTYSQYENGLRQIDDEIKIKLSKFFNVPIDYLLGNEIEPSFDDQKEMIENELGPEAEILFKRMKNATPEQLKYIKAILDADDEKEGDE